MAQKHAASLVQQQQQQQNASFCFRVSPSLRWSLSLREARNKTSLKANFATIKLNCLDNLLSKTCHRLLTLLPRPPLLCPRNKHRIYHWCPKLLYSTWMRPGLPVRRGRWSRLCLSLTERLRLRQLYSTSGSFMAQQLRPDQIYILSAPWLQRRSHRPEQLLRCSRVSIHIDCRSTKSLNVSGARPFARDAFKPRHRDCDGLCLLFVTGYVANIRHPWVAPHAPRSCPLVLHRPRVAHPNTSLTRYWISLPWSFRSCSLHLCPVNHKLHLLPDQQLVPEPEYTRADGV